MELSGTTYRLRRRARDGVQILELSPDAASLRLLRPPSGPADGGAVAFPTRQIVNKGARVDVEMRDPQALNVVLSGVVTEMLPGDTHNPHWISVKIVRSHGHRMRRAIDLCARALPSPLDQIAAGPVRVRARPTLLSNLQVSQHPASGGALLVPARGRQPGARMNVELSFGPMADEIFLTGQVSSVRRRPFGGEEEAMVEIIPTHRHRVRYVSEVLQGMREASARTHRRHAIRVSGRWWAADRPEPTTFEDIGRGGLFVPTHRPAPIGAPVPIELIENPQLVAARQPLRLEAQVAWQSQDPYRPGFGARFQLASRELSERLRDMLDRHASLQPAWA